MDYEKTNNNEVEEAKTRLQRLLNCPIDVITADDRLRRDITTILVECGRLEEKVTALVDDLTLDEPLHSSQDDCENWMHGCCCGVVEKLEADLTTAHLRIAELERTGKAYVNAHDESDLFSLGDVQDAFRAVLDGGKTPRPSTNNAVICGACRGAGCDHCTDGFLCSICHQSLTSCKEFGCDDDSSEE